MSRKILEVLNITEVWSNATELVSNATNVTNATELVSNATNATNATELVSHVTNATNVTETVQEILSIIDSSSSDHVPFFPVIVTVGVLTFLTTFGVYYAKMKVKANKL
jgi:hypothetical protein